MTLRYRALVDSLRSMRGTIAEVPPTEAAVHYRAHTRRGIAPLADLYLPLRPTGASVMLVHGGAFVIGSRRMKPMRFLAARLFAAGIAVCAVDYRLIFRGGRLDEAVDDVCEAFAFWHARVPELGLDARAISMVGLSAGASIGTLSAARTEPSRLAALAWCFGLWELDHLHGPMRLLPRLLFRSADRAAWSERFAKQPTASTLLLHGSDDGLVPVEQAHRLAAHRESLGLSTRLVIYPGAPHGFFNLPSPAAEAGVREIISHVNRAQNSS